MRKSVKEVFEKDQVSVLEIGFLFIQRKRFLLTCVAITLFLGIVYHFSATKEYESVSAKLSEIEDNNLGGMGQLSDLAGLTGVAIPGGGTEFDQYGN